MSENIENDDLILVGEYQHTVDSQRRTAIPSAWRGKKGNAKFFLFPGRNSSLQLIPYETFKSFLQKVRKISFANAKASLALAQIGAKAQECLCDKQGRIQIPQRLLDYAKFDIKQEKSIVLVGSFSYIQLFSLQAWEKMQPSDEDCLDQIQAIHENDEGDIMKLLQGLGG